MLRIALLISLLASLLFMISRFNPEPLPQSQAEQGRSRARSAAMPGIEAGFGQKPAVRAVPEVYSGYLFNEERKLDEADFGEFGSGSQETPEATAAGLEQVYYTGSVIVGDRRQALITYQENIRGGSQAARLNSYPRRGRVGAAETMSGSQNKVLIPGDHFMGYVVAAIEPEKIVFEKGGEKVVKFLYDQNKKRPAVSEAPRTAAPFDQAGVNAPVRTSPANQPPTNPSVSVRTVPGVPSRAVSPSRRAIRSRRLPGLPAQPVPSNNQSEP